MAVETTPTELATTASSAGFDPAALRRDFPILEQVIHGHPLAYLDSASSSQKPRVVIDAVADFYREYNANVHRGIYTIGEKATAAYEAARVKTARFINAPDSHEIVFTRNATEAINLVAYSWGRRNIARGDQIILTEMEHHANLVPWQLLVRSRTVTSSSSRSRTTASSGSTCSKCCSGSNRSSSPSRMSATRSARSTRSAS